METCASVSVGALGPLTRGPTEAIGLNWFWGCTFSPGVDGVPVPCAGGKGTYDK